MLLLMTNRKSHTRFRLVPKSTTLDDLEEPLRTLFQNTCDFQTNHENLNEDRLYSQRLRCSTMTLDSGNIRLMRIFAVVLKIYVNFPDFTPTPVYYVYTYLTLFSLSSSVVLFTTVIYQWLAEMW